MSLQLPETVKRYVLQFADLYHKYKIEAEKFQQTKFRICSSLSYYKSTKLIELSYNDKPGDILPPMSIYEIKNTPDILAGLHPIDVNSINDLYYLSQDSITKLLINNDKIQAYDQNGHCTVYDVNEPFDDNKSATKRIAFLIGYMQAEKLMRQTYIVQEKYKIIRDNITSLCILDTQTQKEYFKNPIDILFSNEYQHYSKEDVSKIGFICGQMTKI